MARYLAAQIKKDLKRKMVFVAGPRQVGKTTLAKHLLTAKDLYLSWDIPSEREQILKRELPERKCMVAFDEIHKYRKWRNYLKGLFDEHRERYHILVTGSAKLDVYRFGGDSLQGRYHFLRLHPFSLAELGGAQSELESLLQYGGFPEPFFAQSHVEAKRWSQEYRQRLIREEITSLERIHDLGTLELLILRLPELVGSPLSLNALKEDLQVNHGTVANWLKVLEKLYAIYRLPPFGAPKIKAVKKEQKHYHYDWTLVQNPGFRFENMIANHLLKWVHYQQDVFGRELELRYFRDVYKREVDFVLLENRKAQWFIECKLSDEAVNPHLHYLSERFPEAKAFQISFSGKKDYRSKEGVRVCPAAVFLKDLV